MLTIVICTDGRYNYLYQLLNDLSNFKIPIWIIDFNNKKDKKKNYQNINKNIKLILNDKCSTFSERFVKYIKLIKTKYVWFIGDDDRVESNYLEKLILFLKKNNFSGFTLGYEVFRKDPLVKKKNQLKKIEYKYLNIYEDVHNLGLVSTQIINTESYKIISKNLNEKYLNKSMYPQVDVITKIISTFNDWQKINNTIVYYRVNNFNLNKKNLYNRLNGEFKGYLVPLKKIYGHNDIKILYQKIFFKNVLSWIIYCIVNIGKKNTFKILKNNNKIIPFIFCTHFIKAIILITPLSIIKIVREIKQKLTSK
jgi:hypothetical protein